MPRLVKKTSKKRGLPPGTLIHVGEKKTEKVSISIIDYSLEKFDEIEVENVEDCFQYKNKPLFPY